MNTPPAPAPLELLRREAGLERDSPTPLYRRLQRGLRQAIDSGLFNPEDAIPPERDLAEALGVSRVTVRRALRTLVEEGLLYQRQGSGTFVAARVEQPLSRLSSFTEDMTTRGMEPGATWLDRSLGPASPLEAMALNLSPGAEVSRLYRLRSADGRPMALELATLPRRILPDPALVENSLYALLNQLGYKPVRALQHLRAELLSEEHARLLGVQPGGAALYIERRSFLENGQPVEFTRSHYRGDAYDFIAELCI